MIGLEGLAPVDGWALLAIVAKAAGYAAALLAMGGPLFVMTFREAPAGVLQLARRVAVVAALVGLATLAMRFGIRAARISGMGMAGAVDLTMLRFVWDSPLGTAAVWRGSGEALVVLGAGFSGVKVALFGAVVIAASYTFVGHALGDPRWLLAVLLGAHLMAAAFWVGALAPLRHATHGSDGAALLHRFGVIAGGVVAGLVVAGACFAWLMTGSLGALFGTAYGLTLLAKLLLVTGLMALAALNKWRLVPALAAGETFAARDLRRSISIEALAVALVLIATATLTSITTPPVNF